MVKGRVFNDPKTGLNHMIDNICKGLQANRNYTESHNSLKMEGILDLYDSRRLSKNDPLGFISKLIFNLAIIKG